MTDKTFNAPGPGQWGIDRSHIAGGATRIMSALMVESTERGMRRMFSDLGAPLDTLRPRMVNGFFYSRLIPLIGADKPSTKLPPAPLLKLVGKVHPEFRARAKTAAATLRDRPWLKVAEEWERSIKPELVAKNRALGAVDLSLLDHSALASHIEAAFAHASTTVELHYWLHGYDLIPLALFLRECRRWHITAAEAMNALAGASASTGEPLRQLVEIRRLVDASGSKPKSLAELRAISPEVTALLDEYLSEHGDAVVGYDISDLTLRELPGNVLASIFDARTPPTVDVDAMTAPLLARVSAAGRVDFERTLSDARAVMHIRDENGPNTIQWPTGLIRRAVLVAGSRLAASGRLVDAEHALELDCAEVAAMLRTGSGPTAAEVERRASDRLDDQALDPPPVLGPPEAVPPSSVLPAPLRELVDAIQIVMEEMDLTGSQKGDGLSGAGIGNTVYVGRVRRAIDANDAFDRMEPGDVLVVRATSSSFNTVLTFAGAVVTANGGPLSHAAVIARELGIPAVVGAQRACDLPDGAMVEVDPIRGRVTLIADS